MLLRYNLEAEGYEVESAARGDEADTKLKEGIPDLVVLDWMLPGLSGIELCRRLRARPETRQLPISHVTARGEESEKVRGSPPAPTTTSSSRFRCRSCRSRARSIARANPERVASVLNIGDIELDREKKRVSATAAPSISVRPIPAARVPHGASRPRVFTRAVARRCLGQRNLHRRTHGRRSRRASAQGDQSRADGGPDPHGARRRLRARRPFRPRELSAPLAASAATCFAEGASSSTPLRNRALTAFDDRIIFTRLPPRTRRVSDQHLLMPGGERWPGMTLRWRCDPAVQAA